jgi:ribosomal protein S27E
MTDIKLCCGKPPIIFTGKSVFDKPVFTVACLVCGRNEVSGCRGTAIKWFNEKVNKP